MPMRERLRDSLRHDDLDSRKLGGRRVPSSTARENSQRWGDTPRLLPFHPASFRRSFVETTGRAGKEPAPSGS